MSIQISKLVARKIPESRVFGNLIVIGGVEFLIRGFLFEKIEFKGGFYVERVVSPVFSPSGGIILDYSLRINRGGYFRVTGLPINEAAEDIAAHIFSEHHLRYLEEMKTLSEFLLLLESMNIEDGNNINKLCVLAVTHYRLGNLKRCREIIEKAIALPIHWEWQSMRNSELVLALQDFDNKRERWDLLITDWEIRTRSAIFGDNISSS